MIQKILHLHHIQGSPPHRIAELFNIPTTLVVEIIELHEKLMSLENIAYGSKD